MTREEIIQAIKEMSVLDLNELVKACEEEFGVSASAPVGAVAATAAVVEEQTEFEVVLTTIGDQKIKVIKAVREITGLGLKEAVTKEDAEAMKAKLTEVGASVEIK